MEAGKILFSFLIIHTLALQHVCKKEVRTGFSPMPFGLEEWLLDMVE
jgi:hypothetical protein